jgi:hypothetical protein
VRGPRWIRSFGYILFALFFSIFSISIAGRRFLGHAGERRHVQDHADHAAEESEWRAPGPSGFSLKYYDFTTQGGIVIGFHGKDLPSDGMTLAPENSGIGSRVECVSRTECPLLPSLVAGDWWMNRTDRTPLPSRSW